MKIIKTKNLILRPYQKKDEALLAQHINDKEIARNTRTVPHPFTAQHAKDWIKKNIHQDKNGNPQMMNFVIEMDGGLIGAIGISQRAEHMAKVGYWLAKPYWGKGLMTEALNAFTKFAFKELKLKRIYAHVIVFNKRSHRVLEKAGFSQEAVMKKHYKEVGKYYDGYLFAKIK